MKDIRIVTFYFSESGGGQMGGRNVLIKSVGFIYYGGCGSSDLALGR